MNRSTRPRQTPVSCQLCRVKKLKCDRQYPCSNCSSRRVDCQPATRPAAQPQRIKGSSPDIQNASVLTRLQKLEDAVFGVRDRPLFSVPPSQEPSPTAAATPGSNNINEHKTASKWLEEIGTREDSFFPENLHGIALDVHPIGQLLADLPGRQDGREHYPSCAQLPSKAEAISMFNCYLDNTHPHHPVIDAQSVREVMDAVYLHPRTDLYTRFADVALLLSIFASASHLWRPQDGDLIFASATDATFISSVWTKSTLEILEHSRRTTSGSIEDIQATIIISYVIYNVHGFSPTLRSLHSILITMARDLCLHKIDSPRRGNLEGDLQAEIKRRIWWHITSSDWLLAFSPGPQEGTYSIHPAHMRVNYPQDPESRDSSELISPMSYLFQRIRLSEICRTIVDSLPSFLDIESVDYDHIISLDSQFEAMAANLPPLSYLNHPSQTSLPSQVIIHQYLIHLGIHTRRSKLHQPFLVRGFIEPKYAYSRNACLRSARIVLEVFHMLEDRKDSLACIPGRLGMVVHHVFMATVVLVMDLCFNKAGHEEQEQQRQEEVMHACRILDKLKQESALAKKFLDPLMETLQKHKSRHRDVQSQSLAPGPGNAGRHDVPSSPVDNPEAIRMANDDWAFDQMIQNYIDFGPSVDVPIWDDLLADFDSYHAGGNDL